MAQDRLPKDVVLLQLALVLLSGGELSYDRLKAEFLLTRRTAERYLRDLEAAGLPIERARAGRAGLFRLDRLRSKGLTIEAVDIPPSAARPLSLLLVAAALLPAHLGVRQAVDATVRAALRLRGLKAASEVRRVEDAVRVLENDAKDYAGVSETFGVVVDAVLAGHWLEVRYRSPKAPERREGFFPATIGLYKGGLYVLAVDSDDDGRAARWRALERIVEVLHVDDGRLLPAAVRLRALDESAHRWGPAAPHPGDEPEQVITLHFSSRAAPYVLARPWHEKAELEAWPDELGGGARMAIRLKGSTAMLESWIMSWGPEVVVLRPRALADRIADELESAARGHRGGPAALARELSDEEP